MPKRLVDLRTEVPLLDLKSYGHPGRPLTHHQKLQLRLVVRRAPEVMVRVTGGARTVRGVETSMRYMGREGALGLETDGGENVSGKNFARELLDDWNLDLDAHRRQSSRAIVNRKSPKLVHNLFFSMPPGTDPDRVLRAVRKLALNEWQLKHRYAMALHTDEPHPHVHVILKARDEQGVRLNIRKATLRAWRSQFASNLRDLGVDANATERSARGQTRTHKPTGIYRAAQRGESSFMSKRIHGARNADTQSVANTALGRSKMLETRNSLLQGYEAAITKLREEGDWPLAAEVRRFVDRMPPLRTEQAIIEAALGRSALGQHINPAAPTR